MLRLLAISVLAFPLLMACVPPTGLSHVVPGRAELRGSVGGGTGTNGPVGAAAVSWNSKRARTGAGVTAAVAWTVARPEPIPNALDSPDTVQGLAPYFSPHFKAGPVDISVPLFLAAGHTGPGVYSNVAVLGTAGLMLSHRAGPVTVYGGALSAIVGAQDRFQLCVGSRLLARNGAGVTAEVIYMNEGQPFRPAERPGLDFRRKRSFLFQLQGSFGRPLKRRPKE